jgi:hypothetical protein
MFHAFDGLPEKLLRKMFDDVWICIHCGSDDITRYASPAYQVLRSTYSPVKGAQCNDCGRRLEYLDERDYGISYKTRFRREAEERATKEVWKKTPLWALDNGKEEE